MEFEFLKTGLIAPKPVGRSKKDKLPIESIWNRYLRLSQETISKSIKDWDNYINKPESRSDNYYSAKNWNIGYIEKLEIETSSRKEMRLK